MKFLLSLLMVMVVSAPSYAGIFSSLDVKLLATKDIKLNATPLDTANATPIEVVPAPGPGKSLIVEQVFCFNDVGATQFEAGSGTLDIRYTNGSGSLAAQFTNGFLEASSDSSAVAYSRDLDSLALDNANLVAVPSADITAGDGSIKCRVFYRVVEISDI